MARYHSCFCIPPAKLYFVKDLMFSAHMKEPSLGDINEETAR